MRLQALLMGGALALLSACSSSGGGTAQPPASPTSTAAATPAGPAAIDTSGALAASASPPGSASPGGSARASSAPAATPRPPVTSPGTGEPGGPCPSASLLATLDPGQGAAGTYYQGLRLTNKGAATCALSGYPGVSFVAGEAGARVGDPARRTGPAGSTVRLAPGQSATAQVGVVNSANSDPAQCRAQLVRGVRVYPPGQTAALFAPFPEGGREVCGAPGRTAATVEALQPG